MHIYLLFTRIGLHTTWSIATVIDEIIVWHSAMDDETAQEELLELLSCHRSASWIEKVQMGMSYTVCQNSKDLEADNYTWNQFCL